MHSEARLHALPHDVDGRDGEEVVEALHVHLLEAGAPAQLGGERAERVPCDRQDAQLAELADRAGERDQQVVLDPHDLRERRGGAYFLHVWA